jgi:hypothetical protein
MNDQPTQSGQPASTRAVLSLVFGILAYSGCPLVAAIVAVVLARGETSGLARAGSILGWINIALCVLALLITGVVIALTAAGAVAGEF